MKKASAFVVLLVLIPIVLVTQCKSKEYPPDYKTTTPILITDIEGNNEDPFLLRAKDGTIYLVWFSERSGNADIYMKTSKDGKIWSEHTVIIKGGGASNFYPSLAQTKDGKFHLTWFRIDAKSKTFSICYTNSDDGTKWGKTQAITPRHKGYNWVPTIVAAKDGSIWIAFSSGRTGNKDVFVVQSKDGGKTWQEPIQVTKHKNHDDLPNIAQKPDGTFLIVWTNYVPEKADYLSKTADIYYATSKEGKIWSEPIAITKDNYTDTIPEIFSNLGQSEFFVAWCSPNGVWDLPLSDLKAVPKHLLGSKPGGYSPRVLPLTDKDYLVAWTGSNKKGKQIYSYHIKKPYRCKKEESVSAQEWSQIRSEDIAQTGPGWSTPIYIESNDENWEDGVYISGNGKKLYFTYYPGQDLLADFAAEKFAGDLNVYVSEKEQDGQFRTKRKCDQYYLSENIFSEGGTMIAPNGDIYYHSNRQGVEDNSYDTDIYRNEERLEFNDEEEDQNPHYCSASDELYFDVRDKEIWIYKNGKKQKMPPPINKPGSSSFQPFLTPDGKTMYLTTNRGDIPSQGPAIYRSQRINEDDWTEPEPVVWSKIGVGEGTLTDDGQQLFFIQLFRSPTGKYTSDMYYIKRQ